MIVVTCLIFKVRKQSTLFNLNMPAFLYIFDRTLNLNCYNWKLYEKLLKGSTSALKTLLLITEHISFERNVRKNSNGKCLKILHTKVANKNEICKQCRPRSDCS